eukprot:11199944-Lingulodinium_polyedra.AAC.1
MAGKCQRDDCPFIHQSSKYIEAAYERIHGKSRPASLGQDLEVSEVPTGAKRQHHSRERANKAAPVVT